MSTRLHYFCIRCGKPTGTLRPVGPDHWYAYCDLHDPGAPE